MKKFRNPPRIFSIASGKIAALFCVALSTFYPAKAQTVAEEAKSLAPVIIAKTALRPGSVSLTAVGDILLGDAATPLLERHGFDWPLEKVRTLLGESDLVIGNLEAPITNENQVFAPRKKYSYKADPQSALALRRAGLDAFSLANNHALDYGLSGMRETISILQTNGVAAFGAGENEAQARRGLVYQWDDFRVGLLSYGQEWGETRGMGWEADGQHGGSALLSEENLKRDIAHLRRYADTVIVSAHWGNNYQGIKKSQRLLGRRAIELGADIVIGHHPHIAQGVEIYRGKPIIYSLGNFVFGTRGRFRQNAAGGYGLVVRLIFENKTLSWLLATPIAVDNRTVNFQPRRLDADEAQRALEPLLKSEATPSRWRGDTALIGFAEDWETQPLPAIAEK